MNITTKMIADGIESKTGIKIKEITEGLRGKSSFVLRPSDPNLPLITLYAENINDFSLATWVNKYSLMLTENDQFC